MKQDIIDKESNFLDRSEKILNSLIENYAKSNRSDMDVFSERRLKDIIKRGFLSEKEFLKNDTETYVDLYCRDQGLN